MYSFILAAALVTSTPADAVTWALTDVIDAPAADRAFVRYVWIPPWGDETWLGAVNYSIWTAANRTGVLGTADARANGWLLRVDLRRLAPDAETLAELVTVWDSLALQDPYFHVPESNVETPAALAAPWINPDYVAALGELNFSPALVYRADWLLGKVLLTIEGGKYYQFAGLANLSQAEIFAALGLVEETAKQLEGDQRALALVSKVTGKPRRVDRYQGLIGRANSGSIWITRDPSDDDDDVRQSPIYNLLAFNDKGRELIAERSDGLHLFAALDDAGRLLPAVPDDVAKDHTVVAPLTARLAPALSCIRCHAIESGLRKVQNDAPAILQLASPQFDAQNPDQFAALQRIAGLYLGNFERSLERGRQDYDSASIRVGGAPASELGAKIAEIYASWRSPVNLEIAARELGLVTTDENRVELFGRAVANESGEQNPVLAALLAGLEVTRREWDRTFVDAYTRSLQNASQSSQNGPDRPSAVDGLDSGE